VSRKHPTASSHTASHFYRQKSFIDEFQAITRQNMMEYRTPSPLMPKMTAVKRKMGQRYKESKLEQSSEDVDDNKVNCREQYDSLTEENQELLSSAMLCNFEMARKLKTTALKRVRRAHTTDEGILPDFALFSHLDEAPQEEQPRTGGSEHLNDPAEMFFASLVEEPMESEQNEINFAAESSTTNWIIATPVVDRRQHRQQQDLSGSLSPEIRRQMLNCSLDGRRSPIFVNRGGNLLLGAKYNNIEE